MAVTETTTVSWGSRLSGSIKGVLFGILLFIVGFPVLFKNEGRAVTATKTNEEGAATVVEATAGEVDPAQEGKLIHVVGEATTQDVLTDSEYGVSATAISMLREVEMYQWVEHTDTKEEKKLGGKVEQVTTYTYTKEWCSHPVNSDGFKEQDKINPPARRELGDKSVYAKNVTIGVRQLNDEQIHSIGRAERLVVKYQPVTTNEFFEVSGSVPVPRIGDIRATFSVVRPHVVTIVAGQAGSTFMSYTAKSTKKSISHVMDGAIDAEGVFAAAERNNTIITWVLRIVGFFMMFFGLSMVMKPISVLADVLPILGDIVEIGTGLVAGVVAFVCALVTIAVAWIFYRPVLAVVLLLLAAGAIFLLWKKRQAKKPAIVA